MLTRSQNRLIFTFALSVTGLLLSLPNSGKALADDLFVGQGETNTVIEYSTAGVAIASPFATGGNDPEGMAFGPNGNLYVVSNFDHRFDEYNGTTGALVRSVTNAAWSTLNDVAFDSNGNMFVSDYGAGKVYKLDKTTGVILQTYSGISQAFGIAFTPDGHMLASSYTGNIYKIDTTSGASSLFGTSPNAAEIAVGPDGRYYVTNNPGGEVDVIGASGGASSLFATIQGPNHLYPYFLAFDAGKMYVTVSDPPGDVQEFDATTGAYLTDFDTPDSHGNVTGIAIRQTQDSSSTPEPGSIGLFTGLALSGCIFLKRRKSGK